MHFVVKYTVSRSKQSQIKKYLEWRNKDSSQNGFYDLQLVIVHFIITDVVFAEKTFHKPRVYNS